MRAFASTSPTVGLTWANATVKREPVFMSQVSLGTFTDPIDSPATHE
jgi:hypothetical protein